MGFEGWIGVCQVEKGRVEVQNENHTSQSSEGHGGSGTVEAFTLVGTQCVGRRDEVIEMDFRCVIKKAIKEFVFCCVDNEGFGKGHFSFNHEYHQPN